MKLRVLFIFSFEKFKEASMAMKKTSVQNIYARQRCLSNS